MPIRAWLVCGSLIIAGAAQAADGTTAPDAARVPVAALHEALTASMQRPQATRCADIADGLRPVVLKQFDVATIAQQVLRPHWAMLDAAQRDAFAQSLGENIVRSYAQHFGPWAEVTFRMDAAKPQGTRRVQISAELIRADAAPVRLLYLVQASDDGAWRIVNVFADGVSDLALRRTQYDRQIADSGIAPLLSWLQKNNESLLRECPPPH